MAWIITKDHLADEEQATGAGQWGRPETQSEPPNTESLPYRFRLMDEDGVIHFSGRFDDEALDRSAEWGGLYEAYKWGAYMSGSTDLYVRGEDYINLCYPHSPDHADKYVTPFITKDGWYSVYS